MAGSCASGSGQADVLIGWLLINTKRCTLLFSFISFVFFTGLCGLSASSMSVNVCCIYYSSITIASPVKSALELLLPSGLHPLLAYSVSRMHCVLQPCSVCLR